VVMNKIVWTLQAGCWQQVSYFRSSRYVQQAA
jgi:hypothetical protein